MAEASEEKSGILDDCYVAPEDRVLDPSLIDSSAIDRLPQPTGWRLLILPFRPPNKTTGGIYLPDKAVDDSAIQTNEGYVLRLGPLAYKDKEKFPGEPWCAEKEWIIFARYAGSRFRLNEETKASFGSEVRILNDDEVLAVIKDPNDIFHN